MQKSNKKVSMMVVKRLPKYYQYLNDLKAKGIRNISSGELGNMMGLTPSQIRQDLNSFGAYGKQGKGYGVEHLLKELRSILGLEKSYNCIIIGSGNMGTAISNYTRFKSQGIHIIGMFDADPKVIGKSAGDLTVQHIDTLKAFTQENHVDICILSVPRNVGQRITDLVCSLGIKAILNFVPLDLNVPPDVVVENVNITDSLFTLAYLLNEQ